MTTIPDHYAALGIDPTADPEVITAAYRALAKKFHPDTGAAAGTASAERFDAIQQAYEVLRNPDSRRAYDLELLEATERELAEHLASKRRVVVREREAASNARPPDLDLGDIRPEPAMPPRAQAAARGKSRSRAPFAIPLVLMMLAGGGAAWLFLPDGPKAPPLPGAAEQQQAEVTTPETAPAAPAPEQPAASAAAPAQPAAAAPEQPVFGSAASETASAGLDAAADAAQPIPAPDATAAAKSDKPVFGSSAQVQPAAATPDQADAAEEAAPLPPPLPKAKPAQPVKQVQKPAAQPKPVQKQAVQKQAAPKQAAPQQPRARLAYQDPPQYYPEPDGYPPPPPGLEPPGYEQGYDPPGYEPGFRPPGGGPYRLVIWERQPGRAPTAWSGGVVFKSVGKCTRQGVKAVLRRTSAMDPYDQGTRVWYECQQLSQR